MDKNPIKQSNVRLLLNAEPFGFGPTAAIAAFFHFLKSRFSHVSYVGKGHTFDLQSGLAYEYLFDISDSSEGEIKEIFKKHDIFVTAMDFEMARVAKSAGLSVVIYDVLAWYWENMPDIVRGCDLYIAQDFFGVKERVVSLTNAQVIPPIISGLVERESQHILLNLGGLQNPLWPIENVIEYASLVTEAVKKVVPKDQLLISTSKSVAKFLKGPVIESFSREEMLKILAKTKCAFMTPGLGNIYDSAQYGIPTAWLPPANTSQGQQAVLINSHQMVDVFIDWQEITGEEIGYEHKQNRQPEFLTKISKTVKDISQNRELRNKFEHIIGDAFNKIKDKPIGSSRKILDIFGAGGAEKAADLIYQYANK